MLIKFGYVLANVFYGPADVELEKFINWFKVARKDSRLQYIRCSFVTNNSEYVYYYSSTKKNNHRLGWSEPIEIELDSKLDDYIFDLLAKFYPYSLT